MKEAECYLLFNMNQNYLREKIRKKIEEKNLSVRQLAKLSGVSPSALQNFLGGVIKSPTLDTISTIAKALNCTLIELISDSISNIPPLTYKEPWNFLIFSEASIFLNEFKNKNHITISNDEATELIEEIYYYSYLLNLGDIDKNFAKWILEKKYIKKQLVA